eukprot:1150448-Pelagomonas_calceolata.AAC.2
MGNRDGQFRNQEKDERKDGRDRDSKGTKMSALEAGERMGVFKVREDAKDKDGKDGWHGQEGGGLCKRKEGDLDKDDGQSKLQERKVRANGTRDGWWLLWFVWGAPDRRGKDYKGKGESAWHEGWPVAGLQYEGWLVAALVSRWAAGTRMMRGRQELVVWKGRMGCIFSGPQVLRRERGAQRL